MDFSSYISQLVGLLTPAEWKAWILVIIAVSGITETCKRVFLPAASPVRKKQVLYAVAFVSGFIAGVVGFYTSKDNAVSETMWIMIGVTAGPIANFLHWATLGLLAWKFPALASALKGKKTP